MPQRKPRNLLGHQWASYPATHSAHANLWLHIVAVPTFIGSNAALFVALTHHAWAQAVLAVVLAAASVGIQALGHRLERVATEPFSGPMNVMCRLLAEQWITFPRFVLSGHWLAALRHRRQNGTQN